jgi:hypothetical protein
VPHEELVAQVQILARKVALDDFDAGVAASVMSVLRVIPFNSAALIGVVCSAPSKTRNRFSPAPSLSRPVEASAIPSPKPSRRASRATSCPER